MQFAILFYERSTSRLKEDNMGERKVFQTDKAAVTGGPYAQARLIQPKPSAETSNSVCPNIRFSIVKSLLPGLIVSITVGIT